MEALHRDFLLENDIKVPPGPTNGSSNYAVGEDSFDNNMVIILAALLCALICALGLNSIVRCALRCSHRFAFETAEQQTARLASKGLKKDTLTRIPVVVYGAAAGMTATDCPICLGEFKEGQKVRIMPKCSHGFHVKCIDTWLRSHSSCPICRQLLFEPSSSVTCADVDHVV